MKAMKWITLSVVAAAVACTSLITACGPTEEEPEVTEYTVTYYDGTKHNTDIMLSERQVITLFRLCKRFNIDFEKMLNDNIGFCMQVEGSRNKRVGDENQKCINRSLRSIR